MIRPPELSIPRDIQPSRTQGRNMPERLECTIEVIPGNRLWFQILAEEVGL